MFSSPSVLDAGQTDQGEQQSRKALELPWSGHLTDAGTKNTKMTASNYNQIQSQQ